MERGKILDVRLVLDEWQHIRRGIYPRDGSEWVPHGRYVVLRANGGIHFEIAYRHGVIHGRYMTYWPDGTISTEGQHDDGEQDGVWHYYNENGAIIAITHFQRGEVIEDSQYIYSDDGTLLDIVRWSELKRIR